jgi:N-acyl-D-amino-acid deacylase
MSAMRTSLLLGLTVLSIFSSSLLAATYDLVIRDATVYDGSGEKPYAGAIAINGDTIAVVGPLKDARGRREIDAAGLAVAPGFINMLSWSNESLIRDGRSQSDIRQGVTLEVLGEGSSMGPWNERMKKNFRERQDGEGRYEIRWTTLGEYLDHLARRGVSPNIASFVGAATVRIHEIGYENRRPTPDELDRMRNLVRQAMQEGAVGVSSALIYSPGAYAETDELVELAKVGAEFGGLYISHIRGEGDHLLEALNEFLTIVRKSGGRGEIYHLKAGWGNWPKFDVAIQRIEAARAEGLQVTADMYTYHASATGLDAVMPPWVQEGGQKAWAERMKDPQVRQRLAGEMDLPGKLADGTGEGSRVVLTGFRNPVLRPLAGKTLAEVAAMRGKTPQETAMDLVIEDDSRVGVVMFSMSEDNVRKGLRLPWVSFCSDSASMSAEGSFLKSTPHPRAYGSFARLLGKYVRDEKLVPLEEAVRRLTSLPAENLRIQNRGRLAPGFYADVVVFDPAGIEDRATFERPHQYAVGVRHVFVNGVQVLKNGEHTGAKPGRVVHGPGKRIENEE